MKLPTNLFRCRAKERARRIKREMQRRAREQAAEAIRAKRATFFGLFS